MEIVKVESSNIDSIGYDKNNQTLLIAYKNGRNYHYNGVELKTYEDFKNADSKGKFFWENINKKYEYKEIR